MPRLLRVFSEPAYPVIKEVAAGVNTEEKHEGVARNYLADDFNLPKKSKVGLTSINIGIQPNTFNVNDTNEKFTFRTSRNHTRQQVQLTPGTYTTDLDTTIPITNPLLQNMVEYQMNQVLQAEDWGFMWKCGMNENHFEIAYKEGEASELMTLLPEPNCRQDNCGFSGAPNYEWNNLGGGGIDFDAFVISKMPVCLGAGELVIIYTKIGTNNEFIGGLIDPFYAYPAPGGILGQNRYRYGFRCDVAGNIFVSTSEDGGVATEVDTGTNLDLAGVERLVLRLDNGQLKLTLEGVELYNYATDGIANGTFQYGQTGAGVVDQSIEEGYLGGISFLSNNNPILTNFRVCENPFLADNPPASPPPVVSLNFSLYADSSAKLLGYNSFEDYTRTGNTNTFKADRPLDSVNIGQEEGYPFLIEVIAPFNLQSFNGASHHRENIIKYLVDYSVISNSIYFNTETPMMLELNNANEIPLKEIGIRIRNLDGTIIKEWYLLQAVLIFDS